MTSKRPKCTQAGDVEPKRDDRYIVVKRSDLDQGQETRLLAFLDGVLRVQTLDCNGDCTRNNEPMPPAGSPPEVFEPHGWAQTDGPAINAFTQEFDVAEGWAMAGYGTVELLNREHVDAEIDRLRGEHQALEHRCQAAERRGASHENMLRWFAASADVDQVGTLAVDYVAALKPTESGASHVD